MREDEEGIGAALGAALRPPSKAQRTAALRPDGLVQPELGLEGLSELEKLEKLRGQYDVSRLAAEKLGLITFLLSVPGTKINSIARIVGVAWETVEAVSIHCQPTIREFKDRLKGRLMRVAEAAATRLLAQAEEGELSAFDLHMIVQDIMLLGGEPTSIAGTKVIDPEEEELKRLLSARVVPGMVPGMVLEAGNDFPMRPAVPRLAEAVIAPTVDTSSATIDTQQSQHEPLND